MATLYWEVPLTDYFETCELLAEYSKACQMGPLAKIQELEDRIRKMPSYPSGRTADDVVVVIPHKARIWVTEEN